MRTRLTPTLMAMITALVLALGLVAPAMAQSEPDPVVDTAAARERDSVATEAVRVARRGALEVHHDAVEVVLASPGSDGHRLGDVRIASIATSSAEGSPLGRLDATLTTTAVDVPAEGDETRSGVLIFTFGESGEHQVTVQGVAQYPRQGPTIAVGDSTVRPIVGGSGRFAGVAGSAVSEHLEDGSWVHTLRFYQSKADAAVERAVKQRLREGLRTWRAERKQARAERKEARAERKAIHAERKVERKEARVERKETRAHRNDERRIERAQRKAERKAARAGTVASAIDQLYTDAAADESGVARTGLGLAEPGSAPAQELGLWHYAIAAGEELAPHTHPGWQLARITAGELEYSVLDGEGLLLRADGSSETMGPGTYLLATGDGVIENPDLVHLGANRGDEVVTIISATLFEAGESIATLVEEPATADE